MGSSWGPLGCLGDWEGGTMFALNKKVIVQWKRQLNFMKPKNIKGILVYFIFPASLGQFPLWPIGIERYLDRFQVNRNRFIGSESDYRLLRLPQPPVYFFKLVYFLKITQGPTRFFNGNFWGWMLIGKPREWLTMGRSSSEYQNELFQLSEKQRVKVWGVIQSFYHL